ncbi:hypothetical protein N657DRAFT_677153 [Parathielavia appendiculata]|uniref:Uncharacterized protein n=1 Tax=Parathielavia appendiculata TaxID=2587402 RepID=A0AAN6UAP5_9PEZI|nr:hypothetical protein N657DRAFT_677153 [Parathielavia appendiculata]
MGGQQLFDNDVSPLQPQILSSNFPIKLQVRRLRNQHGSNLRLLWEYETHNTYILNGWGFTIYRAAFGPGFDERFAAGLKRLENWLRFIVRQSRYDAFGKRQDLPSDPDSDAAALLAERLWNEVVEEYPDKEKNISGGEEGSEDFAPVGKAFIRWANELGKDLSQRNARYHHCLVLDETALNSTLEGSLEKVPELKSRPAGSQEGRELTLTCEGLGYGCWAAKQ